MPRHFTLTLGSDEPLPEKESGLDPDATSENPPSTAVGDSAGSKEVKVDFGGFARQNSAPNKLGQGHFRIISMILVFGYWAIPN